MSTGTSKRLPPGWVETTVEQVGRVQLGRQRSPKDHDGPHMRPYLRVANVFEDRIDTSDILSMNFSPQEYERYRLEPGDVLLNEGQSLHLVGRPALYKGEVPGACFQNTLVRFRPYPGVTSEFALLVFRSHLHTQRFRQIARWTTNMAHLGAERFAGVEFRLAPLAEQKRIIEASDSLFTRLDDAVANLERVQRNLKRYRASVLKAAVEGRLVSSGHASSFAPSKWTPLSSVISGLEQGWSPKCDSEPSEDNEVWSIMKTTAVQPMRFDSTQNKRLPEGMEPRSRLEVKSGDMLITRAGPRSRAGVACLVRSTRPRLMICDKVYRFRARAEAMSSAFLEIALNSPTVVAAIDAMKTGISESGTNLTQEGFGRLLVPVPPVHVQHEVEREVERALSITLNLKDVVGSAELRIARLRQSILKWAFEGKLVDQDPSDEPASALLARIRAERPSDPPKKVRRGT